MTRPTPGAQVAAGRLRVDAAKAIAKLREYQLADRTAWVLEAIRALVAGGATRLVLTGDANDVWLAADGPAWPADDLPRLFDELVSPEPASERHHLRLLAAAVNSALGMTPAYVDVFAIAEAGSVRARYTPEVLEEPGPDGESALRAVAAIAETPPAGIAPATGMLVHLRRRASLGMIAHLFWEREPPELPVARAACRDIAVPLQVGSTHCHRDDAHGDVMRVPLGDGLDGFVAIVDPDVVRATESAALMYVAERGVVLAVYSIELGPSHPHAPVPLRLYVDAARMPTNASRSQVRRDQHPIAAAEQRAPQLVAALIDRLGDKLAGGTASESERRAAIALVACEVAGPEWTIDLLQPLPVTERLAGQPIARDALGRPCPLAQTWRTHVYTGAQPLPEELAPWLDRVLWIPPGDPTARIVAGAELDAAATRRRISFARRQLRARERFFEHAPRVAAIAVSATEAPRVRMRLGAELSTSRVPQQAFARLTGELCVYPQRTTGTIQLLHHQREIERVVVDSLIGFEAVVDAATIVPDDRYRGVVRDAEFARAVVAAQLSTIRAIEALAHVLAGRQLPDGFTIGPPDSEDSERRLVRAAIEMALEQGIAIAAPLERVPVWRTEAHGLVSLETLRTQRVIGVTINSGVAAIPKDRIAVVGLSRMFVERLVSGVHVVGYDGVRGSGGDAAALAKRLAFDHRNALVVRDAAVAGAIAACSGATRLDLYHTGVLLESRPYTPTLLPACVIAADSPAIVPTADWKAVALDGGLGAYAFPDWERAFVRAIAQTLVGQRPAELAGLTIDELDGDAGRALCHALGKLAPRELLGEELTRRLRAVKLVRLLGRLAPASIDELAELYPRRIPYVERGATPADEYFPIVASPVVAHGIARLAEREAVDGAPELELRQRSQARRRRLAQHRAQAVYPPPALVPSTQLVAADNPLGATGIVAAHTGQRLEIHVRIENRSFTTIQRNDGLDVIAYVELHPRHADATFEKLSGLVEGQLVAAVTAAVPALFAEVAATAPHLLADLGPVRTLLAQRLARGGATDAARTALCAVVAFPTIRGPRASIDQLRHPHGVVSGAAWQTDWLRPADREPIDALDRDIVQLAAARDDLHAIIEQLHGAPIVDVTAEVRKLQSSRRMARGLIAAPALQDVAAPFKRKLAELGALGKRLGHGEIGLVERTNSRVLVHEQGQLRRSFPIDVEPAIDLAIEAPELVGDRDGGDVDMLFDDVESVLEGLHDLPSSSAAVTPTAIVQQAQELAVALARAVVTATPLLPHKLQRSVVRALIAKRLPKDTDFTRIPLVDTVEGEVVDWLAVTSQIARWGDAWVVTEPTELRPLSPERRVFLLRAADLEYARGRTALIDAANELALDAQTRTNLARTKPAALALPVREGVLVEVPLSGDGITAPRGVLGVLAPGAADRRGLHAHRELHPFDAADDPCRWPTIAVVDDARLQPDRTWAQALRGGGWTDMVTELRIASERALVRAVEPPTTALAIERFVQFPDTHHGTKLQVRGALWLDGAPLRSPPATVRVVDAYGTYPYVCTPLPGIGGMLYVHAPDGWNRDKLLLDACAQAYGRLAKQLAKRTDPLAAAHVAHAIAGGQLQPTEVAMTFSCFRPAPLSALELAALLRGTGQKVVVRPDDDPGIAGVVDDGSPLARVVVAALGARAVRPIELAMPMPVPVMPAARWLEMDSKPEPAHPLEILADAVLARLVELGVPVAGATVTGADEPIVRVTGNVLRFAGDNRRLHAVANALTARSPWAPLAVDALVAHAANVLNAALTDVTDATELHVLAQLLLARS